MIIRKLSHACLAVILLFSLLGGQKALATVTVTIQPQSQVSFVGSNVTFTAQTATTAGEVVTGYTWKFSTSTNGQPPFSAISGVTNSVLSISNVQTTNAGYYFVSLTYNSGTNTGLVVVSTVATLSVHDQARITSQPQGGLIRSTGASVSFSVGALGQQPLNYQWRFNGTNLVEGGRINGSTTSTLNISGLLTSDSGGYDVIVSNIYNAVTSQVATVAVYVPPSVIAQPSNLTVITGSNAVFQVVAGGSQPLSFEWLKDGTVLTNGGRISGANTGTLVITNALTNDDGNYTVFFSNPVGYASSVPATLTVLVPPVITSPATATGQQGYAFNYTATASGTLPITFGAQGLPAGLSIDSNSGVISGIPSVFGNFGVILYATNAASVASANLLISLTTDVPGITSPLSVSGKQGQNFTYAITASNNPVTFTASGLPPGLNFNPATGVISGPPLYSGTNTVTISAANQYGGDTETLSLNIASAVPVITSKLTAKGTENQSNFTYTITASNSPTIFGAIGLPQGLNINTNTGVISGTLTYGGTNKVLIWAANAYGTGSNTLQLAVAYASLPGLAITDVSASYAKPYLLDFTFSLRDDTNAVDNASLGNAVVRPPEQIQVQCMEGNVNSQTITPIPDETAFVLDRAISKKTFETCFVLDYSYSMFITPGAIDNMQASVEGLINSEPASAQFAVYEFSADYIPPQLVTTNGFTSDKALLVQDIEGIQNNFVQGNYAGTRFYDALAAALGQFSSSNANANVENFLVVMSDGYDDSSVLKTNKNAATLPDVIVNLATNNSVKVYCIGFGPNPNTNVLQYIASNTQGRYYAAATAADVAGQFALLLKDLNAQYVLRWATLQRAPAPSSFQPMFSVTVNGVSASFNAGWQFNTNYVVDTNSTPPVTNAVLVPTSLVPFYTNALYSNDVRIGSLNLYGDAQTNASMVTLNAFYIPRFVREIRVHYAPNYPCVPTLLSTNAGDFLAGWSLTQTNDPTNGYWLTLASPSPTNVLTSLPYGIMGDLVGFQFKYQALVNPSNAFSLFTVDNSIYTNNSMLPGGQSFVLTNSDGSTYVTNLPPLPPHGTPVPWLVSYGFTNNPAQAELIVTNGMPLWEWYLTGLNPLNPSNSFILPPVSAPQSNSPPVITFNTAVGRTYRVDAAVALGAWVTLQDNIAGTGYPISIPDNRNLSGVNSMFYRVVLTY